MVQTLIMASKVKQWILYVVFVSMSLGCEHDIIDVEDLKQPKGIVGIDRYMDFPDVGSHSSRQGCAYFENTLFVFHNTNDIVEVYDLKKKTLISILDMSLFDLSHTEYHCNNANFSANKYNVSDSFPLLYVSMENINQRKILVLRINLKGNKYKFEHIQTIQLPNSNDLNLFYPNSYLDAKDDAIWVSGYSINNFISSPNNKLVYIKFNLPKLEGEKEVVLGAKDIIQKSEFDSFSSTQGGQLNNGFLYQVFGISPPLYLKILDLEHSIVCYSCAISDYNQAEPEGLFFVNNHIYYSTESNIYEIRFE